MRIGLFRLFFNRLNKKCFYKINGRKTQTRKTEKVETAIVPVEEPSEPPEAPEPPKVKRTRKKPDPETAISTDVSFKSKRGDVNFKAMRAPKLERQDSRPYSQIHDMFAGPYDHFSIAA